MGICFSKKDSLREFFDAYVMIYPGSRLYISQLAVKYVWRSECYKIFEYINEEDPLKLKNTYYSIKNTLDCIGRYRKRTKRPFLYPDELERYNLLMSHRTKNDICGFEIHTIQINKVDSEYLNDCKLI
jgi:hypothetical protein